MIVWPALLPPWKRITSSACSASRSTTFPFPSSPHWAPTITSPAIASASVGSRYWKALCARPAEPAACALRALRRHAEVRAHDRDRVVADLDQARDGARSDLPAQAQDR